jgi:hypothetical protein
MWVCIDRARGGLQILPVGLVRHFEPLMGKFLVLTFDLWVARSLCALFALHSPRTVFVGSW